jgi:hypothetical protein
VMRLAVLCAGHAQPHAGWVAIDELADLLVRYFDAELLSPHPAPKSWAGHLLRRRRARYLPLQCVGGDVLLVVAHSPADLDLIEAIPDCRRKFGRIHAWVTDSYFQAGFGQATALYDSITVTAHEDLAFPREKFGIEVHQLYQGADCLTWAPRREGLREIDLMGFGRMPPSYHARFMQMFHAPESPHLYLHSPLGNVTGPSVRLERGMLFKLLHRTRVSLAFNLYVEPQGDRPRSMMVTSRWLESLLSGCIVAGKRPVSRMADDMLFWPGATVELSDDPRRAGEEVLDLLSRDEGLAAQRRSNIRHALLHHDWRDRIRRMCQLFGLPVPAALDEDLGRVRALAERFD